MDTLLYKLAEELRSSNERKKKKSWLSSMWLPVAGIGGLGALYLLLQNKHKDNKNATGNYNLPDTALARILGMGGGVPPTSTNTPTDPDTSSTSELPNDVTRVIAEEPVVPIAPATQTATADIGDREIDDIISQMNEWLQTGDDVGASRQDEPSVQTSDVPVAAVESPNKATHTPPVVNSLMARLLSSAIPHITNPRQGIFGHAFGLTYAPYVSRDANRDIVDKSLADVYLTGTGIRGGLGVLNRVVKSPMLSTLSKGIGKVSNPALSLLYARGAYDSLVNAWRNPETMDITTSAGQENILNTSAVTSGALSGLKGLGSGIARIAPNLPFVSKPLSLVGGAASRVFWPLTAAQFAQSSINEVKGHERALGNEARQYNSKYWDSKINPLINKDPELARDVLRYKQDIQAIADKQNSRESGLRIPIVHHLTGPIGNANQYKRWANRVHNMPMMASRWVYNTLTGEESNPLETQYHYQFDPNRMRLDQSQLPGTERYIPRPARALTHTAEDDINAGIDQLTELKAIKRFLASDQPFAKDPRYSEAKKQESIDALNANTTLTPQQRADAARMIETIYTQPDYQILPASVNNQPLSMLSRPAYDTAGRHPDDRTTHISEWERRNPVEAIERLHLRYPQLQYTFDKPEQPPQPPARPSFFLPRKGAIVPAAKDYTPIVTPPNPMKDYTPIVTPPNPMKDAMPIAP